MKLYLITGLLCFLFTTNVKAQRSFTMENSEDGESTLQVFLPAEEKATGKAVVCCPGGGYAHLCMDYEGTDWAPYFNDMGIAYAVLKYRMPKGDKRIPISDAEHAITMLRKNTENWHINPQDIGIMGFSAGGHLASTVATHSTPAVRPNFQILFYPVISMNKNLGHKGSSENFLGNDVDDELTILRYSNQYQVATDTPPAILFMAADDRVVPPLTNGIPYFTALRENGVSASMHVYPTGGHGWKGDRFPYYEEMLTSLANWIRKASKNTK